MVDLNATYWINNTIILGQQSTGFDPITLLTPLISIMPTLIILYLLTKGNLNFSYQLYKHLHNLKKKTGKGIIVFSDDVNDKTMTKFENILYKAEQKNITEIILILNTFGGWIFAMDRIGNSIQNFKGKIHAYIPRYSMSAGTYIALSCDSIHMSKDSSLGMTDPQIGILFWVHSAKAWQQIIKFKGKKANDESVMMAEYSKQATDFIKEKMANLKMLKNKDKFIEMVTSGNYPHAKQLNKSDLESFGIKIDDIEFNEIFEIIRNLKKGIIYKL